MSPKNEGSDGLAYPSGRWNPVISPGDRRPGVWASTARVVWSIAASTCTRRPSWPRAPRSVLPSTATARRRRAGRSRSPSHVPIAAASASASRRARMRRIVASSGGVRCPVAGCVGHRAPPGLSGARQRPTRRSRSSTGTGQHGGGSHGKDADQRVASPAPSTRVGNRGETAEQVRGFGCAQRGGVVQRGQAGWDRRSQGGRHGLPS